MQELKATDTVPFVVLTSSPNRQVGKTTETFNSHFLRPYKLAAMQKTLALFDGSHEINFKFEVLLNYLKGCKMVVVEAKNTKADIES